MSKVVDVLLGQERGHELSAVAHPRAETEGLGAWAKLGRMRVPAAAAFFD